jgi:hypothetical protein
MLAAPTTNMSPVTQPNILPVTHPIGVWTSTTPCFNLIPTAETSKASQDTTDETSVDFSTSGDDVNDKMNADFSTPSNNKKKTRDNNDTELRPSSSPLLWLLKFHPK